MKAYAEYSILPSTCNEPPQLDRKARCKRYFLLLEVMIALVLVAFAVVPLISPHFQIYKQQKSFADKLQLDLAISHFHATILEKLHQNEFGWQDFEQHTRFPIDTSLLEHLGYKAATFPYRGAYYFTILKEKKNEQYGLYRLQLTIEMAKAAQEKSLTYQYEIFLSRLFKAGGDAGAAKGMKTKP